MSKDNPGGMLGDKEMMSNLLGTIGICGTLVAAEVEIGEGIKGTRGVLVSRRDTARIESALTGKSRRNAPAISFARRRFRTRHSK